MDFKDTPLGKGLRTAYQALAAILPLVIAILSVPELRDALNGFLPWFALVVPALAGALAWLQNNAGK